MLHNRMTLDNKWHLKVGLRGRAAAVLFLAPISYIFAKVPKSV